MWIVERARKLPLNRREKKILFKLFIQATRENMKKGEENEINKKKI